MDLTRILVTNSMFSLVLANPVQLVDLEGGKVLVPFILGGKSEEVVIFEEHIYEIIEADLKIARLYIETINGKR